MATGRLSRRGVALNFSFFFILYSRRLDFFGRCIRDDLNIPWLHQVHASFISNISIKKITLISLQCNFVYYFYLFTQVGLRLSDDELSQLAAALNRSALETRGRRDRPQEYEEPDSLLSRGSVHFQGLLRFFWNILADSAEREAWIASQITAAMGTGPEERRQWLEALRHHFFGLDRFRDGVLSGAAFIRALEDLGVSLNASDSETLLRACGAPEIVSAAADPLPLSDPRSSRSSSGDGRSTIGHDNSASNGSNINTTKWGDVHYSSFLRFVAKHTQQPNPPLPSFEINSGAARSEVNTGRFGNDASKYASGGDGDRSCIGNWNMGSSGNSADALEAFRDCLREALRRDQGLGQQGQDRVKPGTRPRPHTTLPAPRSSNGGGVGSGGALPSLAALRKLFHKFDRNHDGHLDRKDVAAMVEWLQTFQQQRSNHLSEGGLNTSASLRSSTNNPSHLKSRSSNTRSSSVRASSNDTGGDGCVFGPSAVRQFFAALDVENTGRVSYHGLARFLAHSDSHSFMMDPEHQSDDARFASSISKKSFARPLLQQQQQQQQQQQHDNDDDLQQRCFEVFRALRDQLRPLHRERPAGGGMQQALRQLAHACDQFDGDRSGRLSLTQLDCAFQAANLDLPKSDVQV